MTTEETLVTHEDDVGRSIMSWSAVFAGTVVALGLWALFNVFGLAAGLTALDPSDPDSARAAGIGTGIWSVIAPLIALFIGGFLAAKLANVRAKSVGATHGAVLWGLCTVLGIAILGMTVGTVISGTARAGTQIAGAGPEVAEFLDITAQDAVAPINERLREEGKPTVTAAQLRATMRDAATTAVREGELDRQVVMTSLVRNTALDRQDAEELAGVIQQRWQEAGFTETALSAGEDLGRVMWWAFFALVLGLIAALLGGLLGAHRAVGGEHVERRRVEHRPEVERPLGRPVGGTTVTTTPTPSGARP